MLLVLPDKTVHAIYLVFDHPMFPMLAPKGGKRGEGFTLDSKSGPSEYLQTDNASIASLPETLLRYPMHAHGEPVTYRPLSTVFGFASPTVCHGPQDVVSFDRALEVFLHHYTWAGRWYERGGKVWARFIEPKPI